MFAERLKQIIGSPLVDTKHQIMNIERLITLAANIPDVTEFAGGYVKTSKGVQQERGVGAHFDRNTGKYVGTVVAGPIGLPIGALIDRARRKKNKLKTRMENEVPDSIGKGPIFAQSQATHPA